MSHERKLEKKISIIWKLGVWGIGIEGKICTACSCTLLKLSMFYMFKIQFIELKKTLAFSVFQYI